MKDCLEYEELISALVDGEVSDKDRVRLKAHLETCPACAELFAAYRSMSKTVAAPEVEPPETLRDNVMRQVKGERRESRKVIFIRRFAGIAAALVVVAGLYIVGKGLFGGANSAMPEMVVMDNGGLGMADSANAEAVQGQTDDAAYGIQAESDEMGADEENVSADVGATAGTENIVAGAYQLMGENGVLADASELEALFSYTGVSDAAGLGDPLYTLRITASDEAEQSYDIWLSDAHVLVMGADGVLNISSIAAETFLDLMAQLDIAENGA